MWRYNRDRKYRVSAALLVLGLGWLIVFCFMIPWTPAKVRIHFELVRVVGGCGGSIRL